MRRMGKVAAIGTVNPRPGGLVNALVQAWKRLVARVLDWHVREQVEFNRKVVACVDAAIEALNEINRALVGAGGARLAALGEVGEELKDIRNHWAEWRVEWEHKLAAERNPVPAQRGRLAGRLPAPRHPDGRQLPRRRARPARRFHRARWSAARIEIQKRLWADLERIRAGVRAPDPLRAADSSASGAAVQRRRSAAERPPRPSGRARPRRRASTTAASPSVSAAPRSTSKPASSSTCRISRTAATCSTSAAGAASSWS